MSKEPEAPAARATFEDKEPESPPPVFASWARFYAFVVANTLVVYLLLVLFSIYTR